MTVTPKLNSIINIDFVLESPKLKIENVFECKNAARAVFQISKWDTREHMFIVWDLENNKEIWNYSTEGDFRFVQGVSSETGYLLTTKAYVNLDNGIANQFFDYDFILSNREFKLATSWGFKVNSKGNLLYIIQIEDIILDCGNIILKSTYSKIASLSKCKEDNSTIINGNFALPDINFQFEGNTVLHLFAHNEDALKIILEYYLQNKPEYLCSIVMKNHEGKTPLDIAIEDDNLKCTNLLLTYLWNRQEGNFSR